jgi:hypothetical protein
MDIRVITEEISNANVEILKSLEDINISDDRNNNLLQIALHECSEKCALYLISRPDCNINQLNNDNNTALDLALFNERGNELQVLLERSDLIVDKTRLTDILIEAIIKNNIDLISMILETSMTMRREIDINYEEEGVSLLTRLCSHNFKDNIVLFFQYAELMKYKINRNHLSLSLFCCLFECGNPNVNICNDTNDDTYCNTHNRTLHEVYSNTHNRTLHEVYSNTHNRTLHEVYSNTHNRTLHEAYRNTIDDTNNEAYDNTHNRTLHEAYENTRNRKLNEAYVKTRNRTLNEAYAKIHREPYSYTDDDRHDELRDIFHILLQKGADINYGHTIIDDKKIFSSLLSINEDAALYVLSHPEFKITNDLFYDAAYENKLITMKILLNRIPDI